MSSGRMSTRRSVAAASELALWGVGFAAMVLPASAFACPPPTEQLLCVAFSTVQFPVPLSDGITWMIGALLAFSAMLALRRRVRGGLRISLMLAGLGMLAFALAPAGDADAAAPWVPLELATSPAGLTIVNSVSSANPYLVQVSNPHPLPVRIDAITLTPGTPAPPLVSYVIWAAGTTCVVGMKLPSGATCMIELVKPIEV